MNLNPSKKNILVGFAILAIAISAIVGISVAMHAQPSFADPATGTLTIKGQAGVNYNGYLLFTANIKDAPTDSGHKEDVTFIQWGSEEIKDATLNFIRSNGYNNDSEYAADALAFIKEQIQNDGVSTTSVDGYFSYRLAYELSKNTSIVDATTLIASGSATVLDQGYWLFVSPNNLSSDKSPTCPIFTSVKQGKKTVSEKASTTVPSVNKTIFSADGTDLGNVCEGQTGDVFKFEILGTLPDNLDKYRSFYYVFEDTYDARLVPTNGADYPTVSVTDNQGNSYTPDIAIMNKPDSSTVHMSIGFNNLLTMPGITKDTVFKLSYQLKVNLGSDVTSGPFKNSACLTYSNNPMNNTYATSQPTEQGTTNIYSYKLGLCVSDANLEKDPAGIKPLAGVTFYIKGENGKYVQANGTFGDNKYAFISDGSNNIEVGGLLSGKYTVIMDKDNMPADYQCQENDVVITINPDYGSTSLTDLSATLSGGYIRPIGDKWMKDEITHVDKDQCEIEGNIAVLHTSYILPITGLAGYLIIAVIALVVLAACVYGIYRVKVKGSKIKK